ncbi:MAG: hypothetical protein CL912_33750 [Deltaproteobacteria bacterium]|nr:hypothetical protein [Deltaproteobacteria bacterium]
MGYSLHSFEETQTRHQQRTQSDGLENPRPFSVSFIGRFGLVDFESGTCDADDTEDGEVYPAELLLESMSDDYNQGEDKDWNINADLSIRDDLFSMDHGHGVWSIAERIGVKNFEIGR